MATSPPPENSPVIGSQAQRAIAIARTKLGAPYLWATAGPNTFDCSGFTWWVACQVLGPQDHELRSSHYQFRIWGERVEWGTILAGDLVFFDVGQGEVLGNRAGHVGLALGNGTMIHAANEERGVIVSDLSNDWYSRRYIGARRIFDLGTISNRLQLPSGPIQTPNPWNGGPFGAGWENISRWSALIAAAAAAHSIDSRWLAAIMVIETQGIHDRDGMPITRWDDQPEDGPSVGLLQIKPKVWQSLAPEADPYTPEGNIVLGAALLAQLVRETGSIDAALAKWLPVKDPNGTTPDTYLRAFHRLLEEIDHAP